MKTFSIHNNTLYKASLIDIMENDQIDLDLVLNPLYDNTNREIFPEVIRNAVFTATSTSAFKLTELPSGKKYIGIDNLHTSEIDKDIVDNTKQTILIGKRSYSGTYSYNINDDIINDINNGTQSDIYFYNTKRDTINNNKTKIGLLVNNLSNRIPYIQSQIITFGASQSLSLDIINESLSSGERDIHIRSRYATASVNNIIFPTINYTANNAVHDSVLSYDNGSLSWNILSSNNIGTVGSFSTTINIYGNTNLNDYSLEFTDNRPCTFEIGDIKIGQSFQNESIVTMLRRMLYDYTAPECDLTILPPYSNGYAEIGSSPHIQVSYKIIKNTLPTLTTTLNNMIPASHPAVVGNGTKIETGIASVVYTTPITGNTVSFSIQVTDGTQSATCSATVNGIYPYYYGFTNHVTVNNSTLLSMNKLIEPGGNHTVEIQGGGDLCYIYDDNYGPLTDIKEEGISMINNDWINSGWTYSVVTLSSNIWASKDFKVYRYNGYPFTINIKNMTFEH